MTRGFPLDSFDSQQKQFLGDISKTYKYNFLQIWLMQFTAIFQILKQVNHLLVYTSLR